MLSTKLILLALFLSVSARPMRRVSRRSAVTLQNGQDAIALNNQFKTLTATSACTAGQTACVNDQLAQCVGVKFVLSPCGAGTVCGAVPLLNTAGTSITCDTAEDIQARIAAVTGGSGASDDATTPPSPVDNSITGNSTTANAPLTNSTTATSSVLNSTTTTIDNSGSGDATDVQTSLTLDPSVIAPGFASDGGPKAGQSPSLTSTNNFINFCALTLPGTPLTNGQQITTGSCNPAPIGLIPKVQNMPSAKFISPPNLGIVAAETNLTIQMNLSNLEAGNFVNANTSYFAAPQQLNSDGLIVGHSHVVVEPLTSLNQTTATNPQKFIAFQGIDAPAVNGVVTVTLTKGLPAGFYRLCSINTAANHQPVIVPIAQHGSLDDCVYFTAQ